jgi:ribosomal protein L37E
MKCPRCGAGALISSHANVSCLSCGHAITEVIREAWDLVAAAPRQRTRAPGPAWTEDELALWRS